MSIGEEINRISSSSAKTGSGMFGEVFVLNRPVVSAIPASFDMTAPNSVENSVEQVAVKVSKYANADGWLWWAVLSMIHKHENMPSIKSLTVSVPENSFIAEMELLTEPGDGAECYHEVYETMDWDFLEDRINWILTEVYVLRDYDVDYNWMLRGETPVLTDPVAYSGWGDLKKDPQEKNALRRWANWASKFPVPGLSIIGE